MSTVVKRKLLHKVEFKLLKIIPMLLAMCYLSNTLLSLWGYDCYVFSIIAGVSIIPMIFLYISSYVFGFCEYHRMSLHYIVVNDILNWIDYYYELPISNRTLAVIHIAIAGIFLFLILYLKIKVCKNH